MSDGRNIYRNDIFNISNRFKTFINIVLSVISRINYTIIILHTCDDHFFKSTFKDMNQKKKKK